jgi:hypothetical protein
MIVAIPHGGLGTSLGEVMVAIPHGGLGTSNNHINQNKTYQSFCQEGTLFK